MKSISRTRVGKAGSFILVMICTCMIVASVWGICYMFNEDVYNCTQAETFEKALQEKIALENYCLVHDAIDCSYLGKVDETDSNLLYELVDGDGQVLITTKDTPEEWAYSIVYGASLDGEGVWCEYIDKYGEAEMASAEKAGRLYILHYSLREGLPYKDDYARLDKATSILYQLRYSIYVILTAAILFALLFLGLLLQAAGRRPGSDELYPGFMTKIPGDIYLILGICISVIPLGMALDVTENTRVRELLISMGCVFCVGVGVIMLMNLAVRVKGKTLLSNTLCAAVLRKCFKGLQWLSRRLKGTTDRLKELACCIPGLKWGLAVYVVVCLVEALLLVVGIYPGYWVLLHIALVPLLLNLLDVLQKLKQGGEALAGGDLTYHTNTEKMYGDLKKHGENLNNIAAGMSLAVEERLKSERMKTELITNVSHDIKTPLTSIINYASLIGTEPCENEKITEYADVLVRQSTRLKRLIEDLVEASKVSSGNLEVQMAPCDAAVFLEQAAGEYEEKLQAAGLTLITTQPEQSLHMMADGRRMWRIFDNLMNNICKYAQSGTRVYLSLEAQEGEVVFSFKNISREELNVSSEELMERFVRGDASRNTEGNGLGLSIARSMAELQQGSLEIQVDGDLLKAILRFPRLGEDPEKK